MNTFRNTYFSDLIYGLMILTSLCLASLALATGTKVGNGDDGSDLEGLMLLETGPIIEAKSAAGELMSDLKTDTVPHLGTCRMELHNSKSYLASRNSKVKLERDNHGPHKHPEGFVYARTFAQPHSPTRFFPVSLELDQESLVTLHIHEALHRCLPPSVREDEGIVSEIALAISSAGTNHDRIVETVARLIPENAEPAKILEEQPLEAPTEKSEILRPSKFGYEYRHFLDTADDFLFPLQGMHLLRSTLFPFGGKLSAVGFGIDLSYISTTDDAFLGPLGLSFNTKVWSGRGFDVSLWAKTQLKTLSQVEFENSPLGRDLFTVGFQVEKQLNHFYVENFTSFTPGGSATQEVGSVNYEHEYGWMVDVEIRAGFYLGPIEVGMGTNVLLSDRYAVSGGSWEGVDNERYRMLVLRPEITYKTEGLEIKASAVYLVDSPSDDLGLINIGNILGYGAGQGNVSLSAAYRF